MSKRVRNCADILQLVHTDRAWKHTAQSILKALTICACIVLIEQVVMQAIRIGQKRRIVEKQPNFSDLLSLYCASRPMREQSGTTPKRDLTKQAPDEENTMPKGVWGERQAREELKNALKSVSSTKQLADHVYKYLSNPSSSPARFNIIDDIFHCHIHRKLCTICLSGRARCMFLSACTADIEHAVHVLDLLLSIAVFSMCVFVFGEYPRLPAVISLALTSFSHLS